MSDLFGDDPVERVLSYMDAVTPERDAGGLRLALREVRAAKSSLNGTRFTKNMAGMGPLWGYFPHHTRVKVGGVMLVDKLADPATRRTIAEKTWAYCRKHERGQISFNRIRQSIKAYAGHHVSNFRPVVARDLCLLFEARTMFDPCAGWGGRLLGATAAGCAYYGVDASVETVEGLQRMSDDLNAGATIRHAAVEDVQVEQFVDLAFTSPPYFDAERYSDCPEQSWVRYGTYPKWRDGFLGPLCERMVQAVRSGGYVALNIQDVRRLPLVLDAKTFFDHLGVRPVVEYQYVLSSIAGKGEKTEPILVYRKT